MAMKEAIVNPDLTVDVRNDALIPTPTETQVLIKIICAGCNPKDWKRPFYSKCSSNSGDDMAGIVHSVGKDVLEFKPGDRVAAFHTMQGPGGAFAEYGLAESWTTFHIPDGTSFEEVRSNLFVPISLVMLTAEMQRPLRFPSRGLPLP
jgi:NADPH2:quinone reductase